MTGIIEAISTGLALAKGIQQLNQEGAAQEQDDATQDEAVDARQDPSLVKDDKAFSPGLGVSAQLRFRIGSVDIGFTLNFTKKQGEKTGAIGVETEDDKGNVDMEGVLAEEAKNDRQGTFSDEKWAIIQTNREKCIGAAKQRQLEAPPIAQNAEQQHSR